MRASCAWWLVAGLQWRRSTCVLKLGHLEVGPFLQCRHTKQLWEVAAAALQRCNDLGHAGARTCCACWHKRCVLFSESACNNSYTDPTPLADVSVKVAV
jgi:hypothetical protein